VQATTSGIRLRLSRDDSWQELIKTCLEPLSEENRLFHVLWAEHYCRVSHRPAGERETRFAEPNRATGVKAMQTEC